MSLPDVIDTRFRSALKRMVAADRLKTYDQPVDVKLEISAILKKLDGQESILFPQVKGFDMPVVGNFLSCRENCEAAFGTDYHGIRQLIGRALGNPLPPKMVNHAPAQEVVKTDKIDLLAMLPALHHTANDPGRYLTSGIVIVKDPDSGVYNASYHRVQLLGGNRGAIKLDFGRHLRAAFDRAKAKGEALPIVMCIGADIALHYTAATMGSQMPESADELAVAGGLAGAPLSVVKSITNDLLVPAESEIVLEGVIKTDEVINEGPFGEFVGSLSPEGDAPIMEINAVTHRAKPIYHAINGYGRETIMLRKYVLEASLLKVLTAAIPIVVDADMTAGGLHRFHAVIQVKKGTPQHEGLQRNAILAAFGALKDLDMVIAVDEDIDLRDPADVEYALATRMEASKDLIVIPGARGHEYVRASNEGIRAKLGIDATVPLEQKSRFARAKFAPTEVTAANLGSAKGTKLLD